jgi:hypothetical protein
MFFQYRFNKFWLKYFALYLTIAGLVTFSLFILEEAFQTTMFGTWPAQDAGRWDLVKTGAETMEKITFTMKAVNYSVGWIQPLAFISYRAYAQSADFYVQGLKAKAMQHAPILFEGEIIQMAFHKYSITAQQDGFLIRNGRFAIFRKHRPTESIIDVRGKLTVVKNQAMIVEEEL